MYLKQNQNGYSAVEIILVVIVLGIVGFTGWFVYHAKQSADKAYEANTSVGAPTPTTTASSYDACTKASGSKILETYPEQCVSADGKTYTNNKANATKLAIKEWGVSLPLTADVADATYTIGADGTAHITTGKITELAKSVTGCNTGINDIYIKRSSTASDVGSSAAHVGSYYYAQYRPIEPSCATPVNDTMTQIGKLQQALTDAIPNITVQ